MSRGYRHGYTIEGTMVVSGDMDLTVLLRADGEVIGPPPGHRRNGEGHISSVCAEVEGMMKALEEKTGGFYTPSPGSIYPTLQMLEDGGLVTSNEVEGKRVYTINDAGRASLAERQRNQEGFAGPPWMRGHRHGGHSPRLEMQALRSEVAETARWFSIAGRMSLQDPEKLARLRSIIDRTRNELNSLIYGDGSA